MTIVFWNDKYQLRKCFVMHLLFLYLSLKHTPVSYDIWVSSTGLLATLSPQVELTHHPIQFHLHTQWHNHLKKLSFWQTAVIFQWCNTLLGTMFLLHQCVNVDVKIYSWLKNQGPLKTVFNFAAFLHIGIQLWHWLKIPQIIHDFPSLSVSAWPGNVPASWLVFLLFFKTGK